jgi:hypothetical protein
MASEVTAPPDCAQRQEEMAIARKAGEHDGQREGDYATKEAAFEAQPPRRPMP